MIRTIKTVVTLITVVTSVIVAINELKKALEEIRRKNPKQSDVALRQVNG